jgi:hypothetical protein
MLISDEIDLESKSIKRDKGAQYIMLERWIQQENIAIISVYAPNIRACRLIKQLLLMWKEK